ncbi:hypothetical protein MPS01_23550 [Marinilactibacillus psychrotolerans]|uniref:LA2681-like HEPN domain-containing protein n=1 Tax=Marinilactibacillus psychrotolerans TaxID=191770 RepID=A0AAV3W8Z2_9LACT|nr:hypothetical protein MPS01_23550 [Marinilactibacillus psychrotolerans]GEQ35696.1 hypothetical protein M132T_12040 [Marinilactibacillus psychrotolerans]SDD48303.1 hypothetical protein SAMN04488013_1393 [Marinilactibacillus psychrotolerans]
MGEGLNNNDERFDEFAYNISFQEFEKLTVELLKLTRESIIQLTMIIEIEESKKKLNKDSNQLLVQLFLSKFHDK